MIINNKRILNLRGAFEYYGLIHNVVNIKKVIEVVKPDFAIYDDKTEPNTSFLDTFPLFHDGPINEERYRPRDPEQYDSIHPDFVELEKVLVNVNCELYFLNGSCNCDFFDNVKRKSKKIKILTWETGIIHHTYEFLSNCYGRLDSDIDTNFEKFKITDTNFEKFIVSYNHKPRLHRRRIIDQLCENGLMDDSLLFSWLQLIKDYNNNENYEFKCWNENLTYIDVVGKYNNKWTGKNLINKALISLVGETSYNYLFISEKTWHEIFIGQLFVSCGHKNQNTKLRDFGFQLYDEIFDYSFDDKFYLFDRIDGIIQNLKNLKNQKYSDIYDKVKDKIEYNRQLAKKILKRDTYVPKELLNILDIEIDENYTSKDFWDKYWPLRNFYLYPEIEKITKRMI